MDVACSVTVTWMPRPVEGMKASTVVVKSAPANFSFSLFLPCSDYAVVKYKFPQDSKLPCPAHCAADFALVGCHVSMKPQTMMWIR